MNSIVRVFPWGRGESDIRVQVYEQKPSNCDPDRQSYLQSQVNTTCKNAGQRRCTEANTCSTIGAKLQMASQCIDAREQVANECFDGGDEGHQEQIEQEKKLHANCLSLSEGYGC